jgi:hypothetical protein
MIEHPVTGCFVQAPDIPWKPIQTETWKPNIAKDVPTLEVFIRGTHVETKILKPETSPTYKSKESSRALFQKDEIASNDSVKLILQEK